MLGSSLPLWVVISIGGVVVNFVIGLLNPFVAKEYQEKAEEYRKNGLKGEEPKVVVEYRLARTMMPMFLVLCIFVAAASIAFFVESFSGLVTALGGGFVGGLIAFVMYLLGLFFWMVLLLSAVFTGEVFEFEQIQKYYWRRYGIRVVDYWKDRDDDE